MITFQDFQEAVKNGSTASFVRSAVFKHKTSKEYLTARDADLYDHQKNKTINEYVRMIFTLGGLPVEDYTVSNNKIASNFFHRLNTQRCTYSLGNGITLANDKSGAIKEKLGEKFDRALFVAGYNALIHSVSFGFWNADRLHVFSLTEFVPIWDESDGSLKAGIRFWQLAEDKPLVCVLYELDGYTKYETTKGKDGKDQTVITEEKRAYKVTVAKNEVGDEYIVGEENYSTLPIVPFWGNRLKQSTLIGMQQAIDSFDLIRSGFANDLTDCAQIYWLISNYGGMTEADLSKFRDRMKVHHIVEAPGDGSVTPYAQDIPYAARKTYLDDIRAGIYEDFGGLDVHQVNADSTNDHLEAAYQPMDEEADDFEFQCIEFVQQILVVAGFGIDTPVFKRNRISNVKEQVEVVVMEADYLDDETILKKLPNITPDEVKEILTRKTAEDMDRFGTSQKKRDKQADSWNEKEQEAEDESDNDN